MVFFAPLFALAAIGFAAALPILEPAHELVGRALPGVMSLAAAKTAVNGLVVAVESNSPAYKRDLFPHWSSNGGCTTRQTVLARDGTDIVVASNCAPTGTWLSAFDGLRWPLASDVDIDHIVPLKEAWVSGARDWTTDRRKSFANDVTRPQLLAVTDTLNQSKGDKDIAEWLPPLASYQCTYVRAWVTVKSFYSLTVDSAEKAAILSKLNSC